MRYEVSAHALVVSYTCAAVGCPAEAERHAVFCAFHQQFPPGRPISIPEKDSPATETVRETTLLCCTCHTWRPDEDFHKHVGYKHRRGRQKRCRFCTSADDKRRRALGPKKRGA